MHGLHSCSLINFSSFMGRVISTSICIGSLCCMLMLPISYFMTASTMCIFAGGNSSKGKYPNYFPSSSGCNLMFSSISISLERVSAKVFRIPGIYLNVMFCASSPTSQLFTFELMVLFSKNFFSGKWSLLTVIFEVSL